MLDKPPIKGVWSESHDPFSILRLTNISGKSGVVKFCMHLE